MSNVLAFILFVFVGVIGVFAGATAFRPKPKGAGKLVIVQDEVDGQKYYALAVDPLVMSALENGDRIELEVEIRR